MTRDRLICCLLYALGGFASAAAQAADAELIASGETLYNQNCVFCHQPDAIGKPGLAPSLTNPELLAISNFAIQLDGLHHLVVGDGLRLHDQHDLVDADVFVHLDGLDAAFRVAGDDHAPVGQHVGV